MSLYSFNIHELASRDAYFYCYDETIAKKGSNDVVSMLDNFIESFVPKTVSHLHIFCDSCAGQNKNYGMMRYLHYLVHVRKRFKSVIMTFPVRGHSYLECDKKCGVNKIQSSIRNPRSMAKGNCRIAR